MESLSHYSMTNCIFWIVIVVLVRICRTTPTPSSNWEESKQYNNRHGDESDLSQFFQNSNSDNLVKAINYVLEQKDSFAEDKKTDKDIEPTSFNSHPAFKKQPKLSIIDIIKTTSRINHQEEGRPVKTTGNSDDNLIARFKRSFEYHRSRCCYMDVLCSRGCRREWQTIGRQRRSYGHILSALRKTIEAVDSISNDKQELNRRDQQTDDGDVADQGFFLTTHEQKQLLHFFLRWLMDIIYSQQSSEINIFMDPEPEAGFDFDNDLMNDMKILSNKMFGRRHDTLSAIVDFRAFLKFLLESINFNKNLLENSHNNMDFTEKYVIPWSKTPSFAGQMIQILDSLEYLLNDDDENKLW